MTIKIHNSVKHRAHLRGALRRTVGLVVPVLMLFGQAATQADEGANALVIGLTDKGTDVLYLPAEIGGDATELLLDTGSGYLALNSNLINSLETQGLASYKRSIRAKLATGKISKVKIYSIASLDLGSGCVMHDVEAAMLGSKSRNILGMNILKRVDNVSLSLTTSTLTVTGCDKPDQGLLAAK